MNLDKYVLQALQQLKVGAVLIQDQDGKPAVYSRLPFDRQTITVAPALISQPVLYIYRDEGPIVRILTGVLDRPADPYYAEIFLDPTSKPHRQVLTSLTRADSIKFHVYGTQPKLPYLATKSFQWINAQQDETEKLLKGTEGSKTRFEAAKLRCMFENPLSLDAMKIAIVTVI